MWPSSLTIRDCAGFGARAYAALVAKAPSGVIVQDVDTMTNSVQTDDTDAYAAVELVFHAYLTGLVLTLVTRADAQRAAEVVFRTFRRQ